MTIKDDYKIRERKLRHGLMGLRIDADYLCNQLAEEYCGQPAEVWNQGKDTVVVGVICDFTAEEPDFCVKAVVSRDDGKPNLSAPLKNIRIVVDK